MVVVLVVVMVVVLVRGFVVGVIVQGLVAAAGGVVATAAVVRLDSFFVIVGRSRGRGRPCYLGDRRSGSATMKRSRRRDMRSSRGAGGGKPGQASSEFSAILSWEDFTVLVAHALQSEERADHDFRKVLPGCSGLFIAGASNQKDQPCGNQVHGVLFCGRRQSTPDLYRAGEMPGWLLVNGSSELQQPPWHGWTSAVFYSLQFPRLKPRWA